MSEEALALPRQVISRMKLPAYYRRQREDLEQEGIVAVLLAGDRPLPYLYRVVRNAVVSYMRSNPAHRSLPNDLL